MGLFTKRVKTDKNVDFMIANPVLNGKEKFMALGAIFNEMGYAHTPYALKICETSILYSALKGNLESMWDITNSETAKGVLTWLLDEGGHSEDPKYQALLNEFVNGTEDENLKYEFERFVRWTKNTVVQNKDKKRGISKIQIDEERIKECSTILAWDYERTANLVRLCYNAGYLSEEEVWDYFEKQLAPKVKENFDDWISYSISFMLGRYFWSDKSNQYEARVAIEKLFNGHNKDTRLDSIWKKYSISDL